MSGKAYIVVFPTYSYRNIINSLPAIAQEQVEANVFSAETTPALLLLTDDARAVMYGKMRCGSVRVYLTDMELRSLARARES